MDPEFHTTRWSVVLAAGGRSTPDARSALETLCTTYWYPLYAYARRRGRSRHEAEDLTQGFFSMLLEKNVVTGADAERGRFRAFLLTVFKRFLSREREKASAQKRGGGRPLLSLDFETGEKRYRKEPSHELTPERVFDRAWAHAVLRTAFDELSRYMAGKGKGELLERLKSHIVPGQGDAGKKAPHAAVAGELSMTEGAVKVAVHRLRDRYRRILRAVIAETIGPSLDVDSEIRALVETL